MKFSELKSGQLFYQPFGSSNKFLVVNTNFNGDNCLNLDNLEISCVSNNTEVVPCSKYKNSRLVIFTY